MDLPGGYQDRLLGGTLGLLDLCHTTPDGMGRKDCSGEVRTMCGSRTDGRSFPCVMSD
jgi:hypothetical protein